MAQFLFTVRDHEGRRTSGTLEAADKNAAITILSDKGLIVTNLTHIVKRDAGLFSFLHKNLTVKGEELLVFTQEMAAMLEAGIPLKKALDVMVEDTDSPILRQVLLELSSGVSSGTELSQLMKKYPGIFSKLYVSMVTAGEASGKLATILQRLAVYIENTENLRKKVIAAFYYPGMVLAFAFIVVFLLLVFAVPRFESIYEGLGAQLPLITRIFISLGDFLSHAWYIVVGIVLAAIYLFSRFLKSTPGQYFIDRLKLTTVIIGPIFRRLAIARFARSLSSLYSSGVPLLSAMELVSTGTGNRIIEDAILQAVDEVREGKSLADPLRKSRLFTPMAISMLAAGEESGTLDKMLSKIADFYEAQVDISTKALSGLIEPLIIIGLGIVIGSLILILGLPFIGVSTAILK
ncbi:MAG: type II secretion system F family protein [Chloroflexi bacterium]|nr:type II secretion system F family protein [Chloroflexota bacterium]